METSSLYTRIQNKLNNVAPVLNHISDDEDGSSGSDVDDDITIEECATLINNRKLEKEYTNFTKVRLKPIHSNLNLRDILSQKIENDNLQIVTTNGHSSHSANYIPNILGETNISNIVSSVNNPRECNSDRNEQEIAIETQNTVIRNEVHSTLHRNESFVPLNDEGTSEICPVKRKRVKLTAEGRKAAKEQKDKEKLEKQKQRENQKLEKAMEKELEKAMKKANTLNNRSERKDECMERILAIIDQSLIEESGGADILKALQDVCVRYEIKHLPVTSCIGWMRENIDYNVDNNSAIAKSSSYVEETHILYKMSATELVIRIDAQNKVDKNEAKEEATFSDLIVQLKQAYPKKKLTIVITGINAYYRFVKTKQNQHFRKQALGGVEATTKRKRKTDNVPFLTKRQIDDAITHVQVTTNICVRFCEDSTQLASFVSSFTKAIAEAPFKKANETSLRFCSAAPSDKASVKGALILGGALKRGNTVSNDGHGILQLWNQQLQQFYGVRHDTAVAITQVYPTPLALIKAYADLPETDGMKLLQDIEVRRGVGVLQTQRRVGPDLSKKLYKLLTSTNGDEPLAK